MKTRIKDLFLLPALLASFGLILAGRVTAQSFTTLHSAQTNASIPWSEIGAKAGADYEGDGLSVTPTDSSAQLHCVFQRLEGEATREGLWLTSTITNSVKDSFRVRAVEVGRGTPCARPDGMGAPAGRLLSSLSARTDQSARGVMRLSTPLPAIGNVSIAGQTALFARPGLVEEYSVSMDGVRQDFLIAQRPEGTGELQVRLDVVGALVEQTTSGAQLLLARSGRKIAYSRLRVTDANGKELPAWMEVLQSNSESRKQKIEMGTDASALVVLVNDAEALYPIRIDPTFSDDNWISLGGIPGADGIVRAAVVDDSGNLYIGGEFTVVGRTFATNIAKWNGSSWSGLGSGMDNAVHALAVSGSNLYAGGYFTTAGGSAVNSIAKWDGTSWSALGSGLNGGVYPIVYALAVSGSDLYAGHYFTTAGGSAANAIAKWNGSSWSALGSGMGSPPGYSSVV